MEYQQWSKFVTKHKVPLNVSSANDFLASVLYWAFDQAKLPVLDDLKNYSLEVNDILKRYVENAFCGGMNSVRKMNRLKKIEKYIGYAWCDNYAYNRAIDLAVVWNNDIALDYLLTQDINNKYNIVVKSAIYHNNQSLLNKYLPHVQLHYNYTLFFYPQKREHIKFFYDIKQQEKQDHLFKNWIFFAYENANLKTFQMVWKNFMKNISEDIQIELFSLIISDNNIEALQYLAPLVTFEKCNNKENPTQKIWNINPYEKLQENRVFLILEANGFYSHIHLLNKTQEHIKTDNIDIVSRWFENIELSDHNIFYSCIDELLGIKNHDIWEVLYQHYPIEAIHNFSLVLDKIESKNHVNKQNLAQFVWYKLSVVEQKSIFELNKNQNWLLSLKLSMDMNKKDFTPPVFKI